MNMIPLRNFLRDLGILVQSVEPLPWNFATSIFGPRGSWFSDPLSEMHLLHFHNFEKSFRAFLSMSTPRVYPLRGKPSSLARSEQTDHPEEAWFFVNGVATSRPILELNGDYLRRLFDRPIELILNPTDGLALDLLECAFGRTFDLVTAPEAYTYARIDDALHVPGYKRIILLAHSQGGIIAANVMRKLIEHHAGEALLKKLEIYTFASAADEVIVDADLTEEEGRLVPYVEHFANTEDLVARLGVLHERLQIAGMVYLRKKEGHLLNAHYLGDLKGQQYAHPRIGPNSRLYDSLDGHRPTYYNPSTLPPEVLRSRMEKVLQAA